MVSKLQYSEQQMLSALEAVKNGTPIAAASRLYGVPRTTLSDKHRGKVPVERKMGPETLLSVAEEYQLVQWMFDVSAIGFPVTKEQLLDSVKLLLLELNKSSLFPNGRPGRTWYQSFLKRHPNISKRIPQNLTKSRGSITEGQIRDWFKEVSNYFDSNNLSSILLDPSRIFNCDETAFFLCPKGAHVLVRKGEKSVYNFINSNERECLTSLVTGNAAGELAPPMVIYSYKRVPAEIAASIPKKWGLGISDNGWMTGETFYQYISNIFLPWVLSKKIPLPVILFLDGHTSHLTMTVSNFCRENQIILVALLPNATHILQPMDVAVFSPLKKQWKKTVHNWRMENGGERLTRKNFAPLLQSTFHNCNLEKYLQNGFRACGLHPFSADSIDFTKLLQRRKSNSTPSLDIESIKYHLEFIEKNLPTEKVNSFKSSGCSWSGNINDKSMFDFWLSLKQKLEDIEDNNRSDIYNQEVEETSLEESTEEHCSEFQSERSTLDAAYPLLLEDIDLQNFDMVMVDKNIEFMTSTDSEHPESLNEMTPVIIIDTQFPSTTTIVTDDLSNSENEPQKHIENLNISNNREIPPPFKKALPWPSPEMQNKKKISKNRYKNEKLPTVITGEEWIKYYEKKEEQKKMIKLQAEEKKRKRIEKAEEKKKILEEKREERRRKREEKIEMKKNILRMKKENTGIKSATRGRRVKTEKPKKF